MKRRRRQYILLEQWVLKSYLSSIESNNSFVRLWLLIGAKLPDLARSTHGYHKVTMEYELVTSTRYTPLGHSSLSD